MILLFKRRSIADGDSTIRTTVVDVARKIAWPSPFTARVMKNRLVQDWHGRAAELAKPEVIGREMQRYMSAMQSGAPDNTGVWVGEATGPIDNVRSAGDLLREIAQEAERLLCNRAASLAQLWR